MLPPLFLDMVSSCTPDWSGIPYVDQASLIENGPVLPPKCCYEVYVTTHGQKCFFKRANILVLIKDSNQDL